MVASVLTLLLLLVRDGAGAETSATFFRGINLNGPPVTIDGHAWEGGDDPWLRSKDMAFDNQNVPLMPPTDPERAKMIRSSRWGGGRNSVEITDVPPGRYSVFLYVWEDNNSETYSVSLNGRLVLPRHESGKAGHWNKLGPWVADIRTGAIQLTSQGGAANFSGIEIWKGEHDGSDPVVDSAENIAFFESRIRPLLVQHCYECHSVEASEIQGQLLVDSRAALRRGGDKGPALVPFDPDHSLLIEAVRYKNGDMRMPPDGKLSEQEIQDLERWVRLGAPDPRQPTRIAKRTIDLEKGRDFWSLRPISDPQPPAVRDRSWPRNDIDRFLLARIEAAGLQPAGDADKAALLRRVTYDLIGLPPTPQETDAFVSDPSPEALSRVVDRLLDSPQYGERWGRYWLDVVRYSDTAGDNSDFPIPQMYRYRNWVIDAFNRDLPYDEFVREQLAGDLLPAAAEEESERTARVIATGYIANARRFGSRVDDYPQHLTIEDTIDNLGRAFLGMSLNCARCHDHKFDPISTEDYYGLYGIFQSTRYPWPGIELEQKQRDLIPLGSPAEAEIAFREREAGQKELDRETRRLEKARDAASGADRKRLEGEAKAARETAELFGRQPFPFEQAYAVAEGKIDDAAVQRKGDPLQAGDVVPRHFPGVMGGQELPPSDHSSGRRQLAEWIVDRNNPLTARVLANRVWQHHFGRGLVPTPNDFGRQGKAPTHPELLDWLASRLRESGWSIKALHRTILLSRAYQLASVPTEAALARDPGNELLSAFPCRRLDAEAIRDTLLVLGGNLDATPGGTHPFPPQTEWKFTQHHPFKAVYDTNRRSVYLMTQRIQRHPYLAIFDGPDPATSTAFRGTSTTPLQALYLLNDPFVHEQSDRFADRLLREGTDDRSRIGHAYRLAFGRSPTEAEIAAGTRFLAQTSAALESSGTAADSLPQQTWRAYTRALFRLNEFVYID